MADYAYLSDETARRELEAVLAEIAATPWPDDIYEARVLYDADGPTVAADIAAELVEIAGNPARILTPPVCDDDRAILFLHGGGYVYGSLQSHGGMAAEIARDARCIALQLHYRRAPEHPFPAAIEDACAAYEWLLERYAPERIAFVGDSAGGGLVMATLAMLQSRARPMPGAAVVISPWVDLEATGQSYTDRQAKDPMIDRPLAQKLAGLYTNGHDLRSPFVSPIHADLRGMPPLLIQAGEREVLFSEALSLHEKALAAGVDSTFEEWPEMVHVWHLYYPRLSAGREAIARVGAFIHERTAAVNVGRGFSPPLPYARADEGGGLKPRPTLTAMNDIPLIDISAPDAAERIGRACREVGFFTVCGHGLDGNVVHDAHRALRTFFERPLADKMTCRLPTGFTMAGDDYTPYGYSALLEENAWAYMGQQGKPSDYVEKFSAGRHILDDARDLPFPADDPGRDLRDKLKAYYAACETLSSRLAELISISLGLAPDFFAARMDHADDSMRGHLYPAFTPDFVNDQGMGQHTDGTLITLLTHDSPGIEVRARNGDWITPSFRALDHFIVNIGDLLAHWTDGEYVSTEHRVVLTERPRQSIVFFKLTNEDEMVQAGNRQMDALFGREASRA
ncbi:MAG TPA: alpha/beta hydrolase fold domain-containing protein [Thermoanaerobaculia bacterium]